MYKIIHCVTIDTLCDITQRVSNDYTEKCQFFTLNLEKKITPGGNFLHRHPLWTTDSVVQIWCDKYGVTNIRYEYVMAAPRPVKIHGGTFILYLVITESIISRYHKDIGLDKLSHKGPAYPGQAPPLR